MIYTIWGNEITDCYNLTGGKIDEAFDINGNSVLSETIDLTGVPEFYKSEMTNVVNYLRSLDDNYVSYAVVNDLHYPYNYRHSHKIVKCLLRNSSIDKCILLGDICDSIAIEQHTMFLQDYQSILSDCYVSLGNHDTNTSPLDGIYEWWKVNVFASMSQPTEYGSDSHSYYYVDNDNLKLRLIFTDPNYDSSNQKTWMDNTIANLPDGWQWVLFTHEAPFTYHPPEPYTDYWHFKDSTLFATFENDYKNDTRLIGAFSGHEHVDLAQFNSGIRQETFLLDSYKKAGEQDSTGMTMPNRNDNDITAQSITVISFNTTERKVKLLRIGPVMTVGRTDWIDNMREFEY